jgi:Holliday junction resolvasome RuvABC endonuclease subunit
MKGRNDREQLTLAIYLTTRGFGFVVFEGRQRTIDWGVKDARGDKNPKVLAKIEELMSWYRPDMLVLENIEEPDCRRADRIRNLHWQLAELAKTRKIPVRQFTRSDIKAAFASRKASTKYEIAQAVSQELPDLAPWLPAPRKIWMSEDRWLGMFDAASLALTFYDTRKSGRASQSETAR